MQQDRKVPFKKLGCVGSPSLEEINIVEFVELEEEFEGGLEVSHGGSGRSEDPLPSSQGGGLGTNKAGHVFTSWGPLWRLD